MSLNKKDVGTTKVLLAKPSTSPTIEQDAFAATGPKHSFDPRFYFPFYQPIVDIPSGKIIGYEGLIRTYNQSGQVESAGWLFDDNHIRPDLRLSIDRAVREKALYRFAKEDSGGLLFLNISPEWIEKLEAGEEAPTIRMIRESGIDPGRVVIEVTESAGDLASIEPLIKVYKRAGLKVAIDDFGVGASQVDRLIALKPDYIKIDMDIFKDASRNGESSSVLIALSSLSEQASFEIICEGVETEDEFHFAIECGAQKIQGWLFGKADDMLLHPEVTKDSVAFLQTLYLERKKELVVRAADRNHLISKYVNLIFEYHRQDRIAELDASLLSRAGLIRYYICDLSGKQISPNVVFSQDGAWLDEEPMGCYWSHRPYFALVVALKDRKREHIVSNAYVDASTKQLCKTTAVLMDESTVMLVDSTAYDDILYCQ